MAAKVGHLTTFEAERSIRPIYTGGSVSLDLSGRILATTLGEDALLTDLATGRQLARIEGDGEVISTLTLTPSGTHLIICSRSLSMRIYALKPSPSAESAINCELLRSLKPHGTPVVVLAVDQTSTLLAAGAADGVVKVWDIRGGFVTHTFRGPNVLVSALHFFEILAAKEVSGGRRDKTRRGDDSKRFRLAAGSQDGKIRIYDLAQSSCISTLDSHVSDVTSLDYSTEENALLSASRDRTIMWWDVRTWKVRKVVPVLEDVETAGFLQGGSLAYTGGSLGRLRIWRTEDGTPLTHERTDEETQPILAVLKHSSFLLAVYGDQTLVLYSTDLEDKPIADVPELRRISGTHDEVIDLCYLQPDCSLLALATNSEDIRIVTLAQDTNRDSAIYFGADVAQLTGHEDIIICLAVDWSGHWLATGAKDNTAKLWRIDAANNSFECFLTFTGHAESIGAIALPPCAPQEGSGAHQHPSNHPPRFMVTGSQDQTVKRWNVPTLEAAATSAKAPRASYTRKAHEKDINALDVSSSGELFASASQDRTVKIWSVEEGEVQGVLRGHRRGVWSVKFAPKDTPSIVGDHGPAVGKGLVLTGSGDKTVKIWSLSDYSCIRTFEGHSNSILKVAWLNVPQADERGKRRHVHVASAAGDWLVKVWDTTSGELECTLDNHEDRVWALAVHPTTNTIVSGGADSVVTFWTDTTSATQAASAAAATQLVEQEQELQNYIHAGSYRSAITLALQLNHPGRLLSLFTTVVNSKSDEGSLCGLKAVDEVLGSLADEQIFMLLLRLRDWNTNARTAPVAQRILWTLFNSYPASRLANLKVKGLKGQRSLKEVLDGLKAYTERHYKRMEELVDESYIVEYTLQEMDAIIAAGGNIEAMDVDQMVSI